MAGNPSRPGAARLLVIGLDVLRDVHVRDEADVGLVDAHAEGDRRDHDDVVLAQEPLLVARALLGGHAGVVGQRPESLRGEPLGRLLGHLAREAIDDAAVAAHAMSLMNCSICLRGSSLTTML